MRLAADAPVLDGLAGTLDRMADAHDELTWQLGAWFVEVPASVWGARVRAGLGLRDLAVRVRAAAAAYRRADDLVRESLARVLDLAARGGLLSEWPQMPAVTDVPATGGAPGSMAELLTEIVELGEPSDGRVRVVGVPQGDGTLGWLVMLPGTQTWDPRAGPNPFDVTTDVTAMAQQWTVAAAGVARALERAQARVGRAGSGDPVMLAGHSQGGILAMALASDPQFTRRHPVTHVLTAGSPVAGFAPAPSTRVLSLEHDRDPVPRLDLRANPGGATWATMVAPVPAGVGSPHDGRGYALTASRLSAWPTPPAVAEWLSGAAAYLRSAPAATVSELRIERSWQGRTT